MRSVVALSVFAAVLAQPNYEALWATFKTQHGKTYNGGEEEERFAVFKTNVDKINDHNTQQLSYTMEINQFADLTEEEFVVTYTGLSMRPGFGETIGTHEETTDLEDSVDWVEKGAVNPIKNQGSCGSCWAFSTVGTLESAYQIATGQLKSLAEQQLVDCDKSDDGCDGGWPHTAYDRYYTRAGVCSEASYTYTARDGYCRDSSCDVVLQEGTVTGHTDVRQTSSALKSAIAQQPISVTVNAGQLQFYANGVVHGNCRGQINHAVIAVGYGSEGDDYFKIRNSWGTSWGEAGYVRLAQEGGRQGTACLLQDPPVYPTLSTTTISV